MLTPIWRCHPAFLAHLLEAPLTFGGHVRMHWLNHSIGFGSGPLDWDYWPSGKPGWWVYDEPLERTLHANMVRKIIWREEGTWESNPGPKACQHNIPPTELLQRVVYNIENNEYKVKQTISGYFARNSNEPVSHGHVCLLLQLPVK